MVVFRGMRGRGVIVAVFRIMGELFVVGLWCWC